MKKAVCHICPHLCRLGKGEIGFCQARANVNGRVEAINYGRITSLALDPIEKKPLYHFHPGSNILSLGSFGCNLRCSFCQNYEISMAGQGQIAHEYFRPEDLVRLALDLKDKGNVGLAFTYNEPIIGYEYVLDCAHQARAHGLKNVLVTNGYCTKSALDPLLAVVDALNIDLKAFSEEFYERISGDLATVKNTIRAAAQAVHVEVTTLIVPGENDSEAEMESLAAWLASVNTEIPFHITRFYPRYQMADATATPLAKLARLAEIAKAHLHHVYLGNC